MKKETSDRVFTKAPVATATASSSSSSNVIEKKLPVLHALKFLIHKTKDKSADDIKKQIEKLGGEVVKKYDSGIVAVISVEGQFYYFK